MFKQAKDEIEAAEWLKSWAKNKSVKAILLVIIVIFLISLCIYIFYGFFRYSEIVKKVDVIYPEVLSNVRELKIILSKEKDLNNIDFSKYKFLFNTYNPDFTTNIRHLDQQLSAFNTGLQKIEVFRKKEDFNNVLWQGESVLDKFNYYFGCKDFFDYIDEIENRPRSASPSEVVIRVTWPNYIKYKFYREHIKQN